MAAAYRAEQRRLLNFIPGCRISSCATLCTAFSSRPCKRSWNWCNQQLLPTQDPALPEATACYNNDLKASNAGSIRTLDHFSSLLGASRRQRQAAAVAGLHLVPVSALQVSSSTAGQSGDAARLPVFELDVLLSPDLQEVVLTQSRSSCRSGHLNMCQARSTATCIAVCEGCHTACC